MTEGCPRRIGHTHPDLDGISLWLSYWLCPMQLLSNLPTYAGFVGPLVLWCYGVNPSITSRLVPAEVAAAFS